MKASSSSGCFVTVTRSCSVRTIRSTLRCPFRLLKQDGSSAGSLGFFKRSEPAEAGPHPLLLTERGRIFGCAARPVRAFRRNGTARTAKIHGKPPERRFPVTGQPLIAQKDTRRTPLGGGRKPVGPGRPPHILMATQEPHRLPETLLSPPVLWVRRREKAFSQKRKAVFEDGTESGSIVVKYGLIIWCFR